MPTLERTWQHAWNQVPAANDTNQHLSWSFLQFLTQLMLGGVALTDLNGTPIGSPSGLWTPAGSSDGTTAAMDGTNRMNVYTKWLRAAAASPHSWLVLKSPTSGFGPAAVYVLFDYSAANDYQVNIAFSKVGFTGGSTTAAPVATDQWTIGGSGGSGTTATWRFNDGTTVSHHFHGILSTVGDPMILSSKDGSGFFWGAFYATFIAQAKGTDLYPWAFYAEYVGSAPGIFQQSSFGGSAPWGMFHYDGSGVCNVAGGGYPTIAGGNPFSSFFPTAGDVQDGSKPDAYVLMASYKSSPTTNGSLRGRLADFKWYGFGGNSDVGKVNPPTGTPALTAVGHILVPTNTSPSL